jgi:hypothetical protein
VRDVWGCGPVRNRETPCAEEGARVGGIWRQKAVPVGLRGACACAPYLDGLEKGKADEFHSSLIKFCDFGVSACVHDGVS